MVNRKTIDLLQEGSATLPSVLKINKERHFSLINGSAISNGIVYSASVLDGAIGNNYNEFSVDFFADNIESMTDGIKRLHTSVVNDIFVTIKKDLELERYFKIFKIDDLSYQAMTMSNYDFFIKLFIKKSGIFSKITSNAIAILKSYTTKEAWILVDKEVTGAGTQEFKLILDFTYRFFKNETNNKMRFPRVNTYSNVQDLFNTTQYSSPYYDRYMLDDSREGPKTFLNPQSEYISRAIRDLFTYSTYTNSDIFENYNLPSVSVSTLRKTDTNINIENFKQKTILRTQTNFNTEILKYVKSLAYEVYGYKEQELVGSRCYNYYTYQKDSEALSYYRYEIFPVLPGTVHYVFKANKNEFDVSDVRKALKTNNVYLYNYAEMDTNIFDEYSASYVDIYTHIPYEYEATDGNQAMLSVSGTTDLVLSDANLENTELSTQDYRSRFDITRTYENAYESDIALNSYQLPYFGNDVFVKSIITQYEASPISGAEIVPQIFSLDIDLLELKDASVLNKYFDILSNNEAFTALQAANTIDGDAVINNLKALGIRENYTSFNLRDVFNYFEEDNKQLCRNLEMFLPDQITFQTSYNNTIIDATDCFFIYIESTDDTQKYIDLELEYDFGSNKVFKLHQIYETYLNDGHGGKFIIPSSFDYSGAQSVAFLKHVTIIEPGYKYYVMR